VDHAFVAHAAAGAPGGLLALAIASGGRVGLCKSKYQLTHSLKAPGFKPLNLSSDFLVSNFAA
jgi:hypothetical protein